MALWVIRKVRESIFVEWSIVEKWREVVIFFISEPMSTTQPPAPCRPTARDALPDGVQRGIAMKKKYWLCRNIYLLANRLLASRLVSIQPTKLTKKFYATAVIKFFLDVAASLPKKLERQNATVLE